MGCNDNTSSTKFLEDMMQGDMKAVYGPFLEKMPERAIILDVGCGSGRDSLYFKEMGHMVVPMDTSEKNCQIAGERIGQAVLFCRFQDVHYKIPFDGIWACGSLIHLSREELQQVLRRLYFDLKQSGSIYISFIYCEKQYAKEENLALDEASATDILAEAGYRIDQMWVTEHSQEGQENKKWLNILAGKQE